MRLCHDDDIQFGGTPPRREACALDIIASNDEGEEGASARTRASTSLHFVRHRRLRARVLAKFATKETCFAQRPQAAAPIPVAAARILGGQKKERYAEFWLMNYRARHEVPGPITDTTAATHAATVHRLDATTAFAATSPRLGAYDSVPAAAYFAFAQPRAATSPHLGASDAGPAAASVGYTPSPTATSLR